jgi:hypothetical protein
MTAFLIFMFILLCIGIVIFIVRDNKKSYEDSARKASNGQVPNVSNFGGSMQRSIQKSRLLANATQAYLDVLFSDDVASPTFNLLFDPRKESQKEPIKKLYQFLVEDEILSGMMSQISYEDFLVISLDIFALGINSKKDFISLSAFCFLKPLTYVYFYHTDRIDANALREGLVSYFCD